MTDAADDLPGIRRLFTESNETLQSLQERLRSIALADDHIEGTRQSLDESAGALRTSAAALEIALEDMRSAADSLTEGLVRVDQLLAKADIGALEERLAAVEGRLIDEAAARAELDGLRATQAQLESQLAAKLAEIEWVKGSLSPRQLKKLYG